LAKEVTRERGRELKKLKAMDRTIDCDWQEEKREGALQLAGRLGAG
jgi:hypothetical protein